MRNEREHGTWAQDAPLSAGEPVHPDARRVCSPGSPAPSTLTRRGPRGRHKRQLRGAAHPRRAGRAGPRHHVHQQEVRQVSLAKRAGQRPRQHLRREQVVPERRVPLPLAHHQDLRGQACGVRRAVRATRPP